MPGGGADGAGRTLFGDPDGVLYSGNFYVVLDPEMPAERVNKILHTLQPTALICDEAHKDDPAGLDYDGKVYSAEALAAGQAQPELLQTVRRRMIDTDPAYAILPPAPPATLRAWW